MLKDISKLTYGNKVFVVDKFSGFDEVAFDVNRIDSYTYKITYFMNIYFSGNILKLNRSANLIVDKEQSWFTTKYTPEFKFHQNAIQNGLYLTFKQSGYKSGEPTEIIPDIIRWYAENTNTKEALDELKKDIKFCFEFIDKYYPKTNTDNKEK